MSTMKESMVLTPTADVELPRGANSSVRPAVALEWYGSETPSPILTEVRVVLPTASGLRFEPDTATDGADYHLNVVSILGEVQSYVGTLSNAGRELAFQSVSLGVLSPGSRIVLYVTVTATPSAPLGPTKLQFVVGPATSPSCTINVV